MENHKDQIFKAVLLSIWAGACFSFVDAARKYLTHTYDVFDVLFWQAAVGLLCLFALSPWLGGWRSLYNSGQVRWHVLRGLLMAANTVLSLSALSAVPLMDAYTIYFTTPFAVSLFSWLFFKERVGPMRLLSIICGFSGALIAFRPGFVELHPAYLLACSCVFTFSFASLVAKKIGPGHHMLSFGVYPLLFLLPVCLVAKGGDMLFVPPDLEFLGLGIFVGGFYAMALVTTAISFTRAEVSLIAPYQYTQMIWALSLGYLVFGDVPDKFKLLGAVIIICSGIVFFMREHLKNTRMNRGN